MVRDVSQRFSDLYEKKEKNRKEFSLWKYWAAPVRNASQPATISDLSMLHAAYVYHGEHHALRLFTEIRFL